MGQYLRYPAPPGRGRLHHGRCVQNRGVGTWILRALIRHARQCGIEGFFAEVLRGNHPMMRVFEKSGLPMRTLFEDGVYSVDFDL